MAIRRDAAALFFFNNFIDSSSESSDEEIELLAILHQTAGGSTLWSGERRPRCQLYVERTVPLYSAFEFKSHFRVERQTFNFILGLISPKLSIQHVGPGRQSIDPEKQLLLSLWLMSTPESYRSVCDRFDVGKATGQRSVRRVVDALFALAPSFIKWPSGHRLEEVTRGFQGLQHFPGVIGAIDGTFIHIPAPKVHHESYINRKSRHAIVLQAVCDYQGNFTHVYAGEVGSVHDARIFRKSELFDYMLHDAHNKFPNNTHLIGDPAYMCVKHLLVAFKQNCHLTQRQKNYNFRLSATRTIIERSFAYLKGRFRRLKYLDMSRVDLVPKFVVACCVLHNMCQTLQDNLNEQELEFEDCNDQPEHDDGDLEVQINVLKTLGSAKRQEIMNMLPLAHRVD